MKNNLALLTFLLMSTFAWAGPGHDHGEEAPAAVGEASPRVAMEADLFEAVAILKGRTLEIFIDHAATNAPVQNAEPVLLLNGEQVPLELHAEGEFDAVVPDSMVGKNLTLAMRVTTGDQSDSLIGELILNEADHEHEHDHAEEEHGHWQEYLLKGGLALLAFVLLAVFVKRRSGKGVKFLTALCVFAMLLPLTSWAGPGHDHSEEAPAVAGDGPRRMPTGEVFLPKPAQRQLAVRTMPALLEQHAKVIELNGKVVLDPQTGGVVQTTTGGRFEAAAGGVPQLGKTVKQGELLGYVVVSQAPLERSGQQAQLAQLKAQLALAQSRLKRVQQLQDTIPKKEIDAAASEVQSLKGQVAALAGGIGAKEALRAPTSGVIASSNAVSGKVFEAGELLFEVINPGVVRIDASWFDGGTPPEFSGAKVVANEQPIALNYLGAAGAVREQSRTLAFENRELGDVQFATGQLLKVYAEQAEKVEGIAVASSALVKNAANQTAVWVKVAPETFEPRVITFEPLDGQRVLVSSGLKPFDRVVVQGASLINQVR